MLTGNMSLKLMLDFKPHTEDMAMLPLDVVVYLKVSIVSLYKEDRFKFMFFFINILKRIDF